MLPVYIRTSNCQPTPQRHTGLGTRLPLACTPLKHSLGHSCGLENSLRDLHILGSGKWNNCCPRDKGKIFPWGKSFFPTNVKGVGRGLESEAVTQLSVSVGVDDCSPPLPCPALQCSFTSCGGVLAGYAHSLACRGCASGKAGRWVTAGPQLLSHSCSPLPPATVCFAQGC